MPVIITDRVGRFCRNLLPDVAAIQDALNRVPIDQGGTPPNKKLPVNGNCGNQTIESIQLFQLKQFGWSGADGKIFPDGETITRLNQILATSVSIPGIGLPPPEIEPTTNAFTIRMSTGGIEKTLISKFDTLFLLIEDTANGVSVIYRVNHYFGKNESAPPLQKFGLPEVMLWTDAPISVKSFQNAGFHYISRVASTRTISNAPDTAKQNTMVIHLHSDYGNAEKRWFLLRRNTILQAFEPAFRAAEEGKYGLWFEQRIEGRIEQIP